MKLKEILARTILASSLLNNCYAQSSVEDYFIDKTIDKIDDAASERIIGEAIDRLITKPNLSGIIQRRIRSQPPLLYWPLYGDIAYPQIEIKKLSTNLDPSCNEFGKVLERYERFGILNYKKGGKLGFYITTANSDALSNDFQGAPYFQTHPEAIRFNKSESRIFIFHSADTEIKSNKQAAKYLSGKSDELKPLEESPNKERLIEGGKILVATTLKKLKIANAEKYLETAEEKYLAREQTVMNEFARELDPNFIATKIPLYSARIFGEMEIGREIVIELKNKFNETLPLAVYIKSTFGNPETGIGSLEVLLRSD